MQNKFAIHSENPTEFYSTYDLGVCSVLVSSGFELVSLDRTDPRKIKFIFRKNPKIKELIEDYWTDRLEVRARTFFDNIRAIKNRIHGE